jgi:hypothetical protein
MLPVRMHHVPKHQTDFDKRSTQALYYNIYSMQALYYNIYSTQALYYNIYSHYGYAYSIAFCSWRFFV